METPKEKDKDIKYSDDSGVKKYSDDSGVKKYSDDSGVKEKEKPNTNNSDFSEYMWMENEEEFDNEVMKQLEEEALMEQCIEAMLEDELESKNPIDAANFINDFEKLGMREKADIAKKSTLNPDAAEFVPRSTSTESS